MDQNGNRVTVNTSSAVTVTPYVWKEGIPTQVTNCNYCCSLARVILGGSAPQLTRSRHELWPCLPSCGGSRRTRGCPPWKHTPRHARSLPLGSHPCSMLQQAAFDEMRSGYDNLVQVCMLHNNRFIFYASRLMVPSNRRITHVVSEPLLIGITALNTVYVIPTVYERRRFQRWCCWRQFIFFPYQRSIDVFEVLHFFLSFTDLEPNDSLAQL